MALVSVLARLRRKKKERYLEKEGKERGGGEETRVRMYYNVSGHHTCTRALRLVGFGETTTTRGRGGAAAQAEHWRGKGIAKSIRADERATVHTEVTRCAGREMERDR